MKYIVCLLATMAFNFSAYGEVLTAPLSLNSQSKFIKAAKKNGFEVNSIDARFERTYYGDVYADSSPVYYYLNYVTAYDEKGNQVEITSESANRLCDNLFSGIIPLISKKYELESLMFLQDQAIIICN